MNKIRITSILFLALIALAACATLPETAVPSTVPPVKLISPISSQPPKLPVDSTPPPGTLPPFTTPLPGGDVMPRGVLAARTALAEKLKITLTQVQVISFSPADWPDSCLGLPDKNEMCAQVITPGYRILLQALGQVYEARTSGLAQTVRFASQPVAELTHVGERVRAELALLLRAAPDAITILEVEPVQWPDSCLGIQQPKTVCLQVITPGYLVTLEYYGKLYSYHTNKTGSVILLEGSPDGGSTAPAEPVLSWTSATQPCRSAQISTSALASGACGMPQQPLKWQSPEHKAQYGYFTETYATFSAETPAGKLQFTGKGARKASLSEQRAIAEWVQIVVEAAAGSGAGANAGLALSWHREGGIAGFCDDLIIYRSGAAQASTCRGSARLLGAGYLSASQLDQLFAWLDGLKSFSQKSTDPAKADAMTIQLLLNGTGINTASEVQQQAMQLLAQDVFAAISQFSK